MHVVSSCAHLSLEGALNALSRALEHNKHNGEIWCHYLSLFSRRGSRPEVQHMCEVAVDNATDHHVWWTVSGFHKSRGSCNKHLRNYCFVSLGVEVMN